MVASILSPQIARTCLLVLHRTISSSKLLSTTHPTHRPLSQHVKLVLLLRYLALRRRCLKAIRPVPAGT